MTGSRLRKVRADLLSNKLRSGLAIVSLAVGSSALGAMVLAGTMIDTSFETSLLEANPPSAVLATGPFDASLVDEIVEHPAVAEGEGRRAHRAQVTGPDGVSVGVELVAMPELADNHVARIEPAEGAWPPGPGELALERASIGELGATIGDAVQIQIPGEQPVELTVTATAFDVSEVAPMLGGSVRGYVDMDTMVQLTGSDHLDTLYLRAADRPLDAERSADMIAAVRDEVLDPAGVPIAASLVADPSAHPADSNISFIIRAMQLLALFALAIAVGLVVNTVAALLAQQRVQLGVMKAMGATVRQLTAQYLTYVGLLSLGAIVLSVPLSLLGGRAIAGFIAGLANIALAPIGAPVAAIGVQVVVVTVLPIAAVVFAVRRACRTTVRDAITDRGLHGTTRTRGGTSWWSRPTLLAARNTLRNRSRLALTVLTVSMCGAVIVGVSSTGSALGHLTDDVAGYASYDVEVALTEPVSVDDAADILGHDAVTTVEGWWRKEALHLRPDGTENYDVSVTAAPTGSAMMRPTLLEGRWYAAGDDHPVVINSDLAAAEPDLAIGDRMELAIDGHRQRWQIVGISTTTTVGPVVYLPAGDLAELIGAPGQANLLAVQLTDGVGQADAAERLSRLATAAGLPVGQVLTNDELRATLEGLFAMVVALLLLIGVILAAVAIIGVAGTMTLGVFEQTRELGVLRTLGATTWAVRRLLFLQGLAVSVVGGMIGIVLSLPVAWLLGSALESTVISAELPAAFSWLAVAIWIPAAIVIGVLGATQPARIAARLTIRDTLAYE